ncbi:MAG: carboxymuconolactone decarboxylase family protein [Phycisphaerales bacterium]|nr:carboxymuconolactone decarboxylase family protein [Phycisphaerales bacterium]
MPRLQTAHPSSTTGVTAEVLTNSPINIFKGLAAHPTLFEGFLAFSKSLTDGGALTPIEREIVMLFVSEIRDCDYCLAAHTVISAKAGLSAEAAIKARTGEGGDEKQQALLDFTAIILESDGFVTDEELDAFRSAGYNDRAAIEVIACITMMTFTNLFNHVHETEIDFPEAPLIDGVDEGEPLPQTTF